MKKMKIGDSLKALENENIKPIEVKNVKGTAERNCKCGTWINHWENFSLKTLPNTCCVLGCEEIVKVGAHVIKCKSNDKNHYIVPFCHQHNEIENECFKLKSSVELISANESQTCDC